jgi:membrane protein
VPREAAKKVCLDMKSAWQLLRKAFNDFLTDDCMVNGAALAYYTIFSFPPLLVTVFYVAGLFGATDEQVSNVVKRQVGIPAMEQQDDASSDTSEDTRDGSETSGNSNGGSFSQVAGRQQNPADMVTSLGPLARVVGIGLILFSATGVFAQLQYALNKAWEVEPDPEQGGIKNFLIKRALSLGMIVVFAFLLLVSLVLTTLLDELIQMVQGETPNRITTWIGILANNALTLAMATVLFAAVYKVLPDANMRWKDTWAGAFLTAVLFVIGKGLVGWYLQNSDVGSNWGSAAGSMIALLVWVYYTSLIVLFGAELAQGWANQFGHGIEPAAGAVKTVQEKRHVRDPVEARHSGKAADCETR